MNNAVRSWNLIGRLRCLSCQRCQTRSIMVWEGHRKREYMHKFPEPSKWEKIKVGLRTLPSEIRKYGHEWREHFRPRYWEMQHQDYKYQWKLNNQEALDEWVLSTDADMDAGYSTASISLSHQKCMLLHGYLNTTVPDDGTTKYAGYVNIHSPYQFKSFGRLKPYDWMAFTHLIIRCRGDGRPYQLQIQMENYFDVMWHDIYTFPLYTRGGPYWQIAKIPFSKFFLANKGRIQDKQELVHLERIRDLSITLGDGAQGPFQLEIDYIGVLYDAYHNDTFFYEMYDNDPFLT